MTADRARRDTPAAPRPARPTPPTGTPTPLCLRARGRQQDFLLDKPAVIIGRHATCDLTLEDDLVSRRHARITHSDDGVVVLEDLASVNGVYVNGARVEQSRRLEVGDRILIGREIFELVRARRTTAPRHAVGDASADQTRATPAYSGRARAPTPAPGAPSPALGAPPPPAPPSRASKPAMAAPPSSPASRAGAPVETPGGGDALEVLGRLAEKAVSMGRIDDAERILAGRLQGLLRAAREQQPVALDVAEQAARCALALASASGRGAWVDYVVELYTHLARPCPASVVDEMHASVRKVDGVSLGMLRAYVRVLRDAAPQFGRTERFLLQRLEGLERVASLK